ncbi:MAG: hypothetical protein ACOYL6_15405 [Bacteriovoracaceae bacterium]
MKMWSFLCLLLGFFLAFGAEAQTACPTMNLYKIPDGPYQKIPLYDQEESNLCYAYSAADMTNFDLLSSKKTKEVVVDPVWVAYVDKSKNTDYKLDFGRAKEAIESLNQMGICKASKVEEFIQKFSHEVGLTEIQVMNFLADLESKIFKLTSYPEHQKKNADGSYSRLQENVFSEAYKDIAEKYEIIHVEDQVACQKNILLENDLKQINFIKNNAITICQEYIFKECKGPILLKNYQFNTNSLKNATASDQEVSQKIRSRLGNNLQPLQIGYCANIFSDSSYDGIPTKDRNKRADDCLAHSSVLVGARSLQNKCQYLLRNTHGPQWGEWNRHLTCFCQDKKTKKMIEDCTAQKNPSLDFTILGCWIPEEILSKNISNMSWIEK